MSFGSQRWFPYVDDDGVVWGLKGDESNIEMANLGANAVAVPVGIHSMPRDLNHRYIKLQAANGTTKNVPILSRVLFTAINLGESFAAPLIGEESAGGTAFFVKQKVPERILNAPSPVDTGKTDGDQP